MLEEEDEGGGAVVDSVGSCLRFRSSDDMLEK